MARFQESAAKSAVRGMLLDAARLIGRSGLTYLGMPSALGQDLHYLSELVTDVIAIDRRSRILDELSRSIAPLGFRTEKLVRGDMWDYLRMNYPSDPAVADVTFLDFCGGGVRTQNPFAQEVGALRSYFAKHAHYKGCAFVFAWTFMAARDSGRQPYLEVCREIINNNALLKQLESSRGVLARSIAVRFVLFKLLSEHKMRVKCYQHALYKRAMNTIILVFSSDRAEECKMELESPDSILGAEMVVYESGRWLPRFERLLEVPKV